MPSEEQQIQPHETVTIWVHDMETGAATNNEKTDRGLLAIYDLKPWKQEDAKPHSTPTPAALGLSLCWRGEAGQRKEAGETGRWESRPLPASLAQEADRWFSYNCREKKTLHRT